MTRKNLDRMFFLSVIALFLFGVACAAANPINSTLAIDERNCVENAQTRALADSCRASVRAAWAKAHDASLEGSAP